MGCTTTRGFAKKPQEWVHGIWKELREKNSKSILPTAYINLRANDVNWRPCVGIVALKKPVDPDNVFNMTILN